MKRTLTFILITSLLLCCCGCAAKEPEPTLPFETQPAPDPDTAADTVGAYGGKILDFSLKLLRQAHNEGNTVLSPVSVLYALGMTANGAQDQTLAQIEDTLGITRKELNDWLSAYSVLLGQESKSKVYLANSIWYSTNPTFEINKNFLQLNADLFGADIFPTSFDSKAVEEINAWISQKTDGMIDNILDRIADNEVLFLINAVGFDSMWQDPYSEASITTRVFNPNFPNDGGSRVSMMRGSEKLYLMDETSSGFIKPYYGGKYGFIAILPDRHVTLEEYLENTNGEKLLQYISNPFRDTVYTHIPIFDTSFDTDLKDTLSRLGITELFDKGKTDLSPIGFGQINISRFLHKTTLQLDTFGTKAAAATVVAAESKGGGKSVSLERPFLYMIVDLETYMPLFMGVMTDPCDMAPPKC